MKYKIFSVHFLSLNVYLNAYKEIDYYHHPKKFSHATFLSIIAPPPLSRGNHGFFFFYRFILSILNFI